MSVIKQLRELGLKRLEELLIENQARVYLDIIDKLVRELQGLPAKPANNPPLEGIFGKGKSIKEYVKLAIDVIEKKVVADKYVEADYIVDSLIRRLSNLPPRGEEFEPYVRLFKLPELIKPRSYKPGLSEAQKEGVDLLLTECAKYGIKDFSDPIQRAKAAYVLGSCEHESGFLPVREGYSDAAGRAQARKNGYDGGELYYGRGKIQITHIWNYEKYEKILGIPLVSNPDLALNPKVAAFIAVHGMVHGIFTGKKLSDYFNENRVDYVQARRIVNGLDRSTHIAQLAKDWLRYL